MKKQPNILFIMSDQHSVRGVGAYGESCVKTPNIDALASSGVRFSNTVCPSPICVVSRASFFCGKHPHRIGVWDNGSPFSCDEPTIAYHLAAAGYETVAAGKLHFIGPDQLHGFHNRLTPDVYPADMLWVDDWDRPMTHDNGNNRDRVSEAGVVVWSPTFEYDESVAHNSIEWLRSYACRDNNDKDPFFLFVSFTSPHDPYQTLRELWDRYEDCDIDLPDNWNQPYESLSQMNQWVQQHHDLIEPVKREDALRAVRAYYANCSYVDDKVGSLVREVERLGLRDDTIVVFASDHGDMLGEHGAWSKRMFYEGSVKVPLVINFNQGNHAGKLVDVPVSLLDLFPTFMDFAGTDIPDDLDGASLLQFIENPNMQHTPVYGEFCADGVLSPCRMVMDNNYKLSYCHGNTGELYDIANDPMEMTNLINDLKFASVQKDLTDKVLKGWDPEKIDAVIRESQKRRRLIAQIRLEHHGYPWQFSTAARGPRELRKGIGIGCGPVIEGD